MVGIIHFIFFRNGSMKSLCLKKKNLIYQVAFPLTNFHIAYDYADWSWNNRNMNPVSPQSYVIASIFTNPPSPPQFLKHLQNPISTAS